MRADRHREQENLRLKKTYKQAVKRARAKKSVPALTAAFRALDRAAKKKIIHKNKASRLKSRLAKRYT